MVKQIKSALKGQASVGFVIVVFVIGIIMLGIVPIISVLTTNIARTTLEGDGYLVLGAGEYSTLISQLTDIETDVTSIYKQISNETFIFPESTLDLITLTAGTPSDNWCAWTEIVDNDATTLTSKFAAHTGHLAEINTEDYSVNSERYMVEIAYGASKTVLARTRVKSEGIGGAVWTYYLDLRSRSIPQGETVYYRMKAETAGATLECSFRYYWID